MKKFKSWGAAALLITIGISLAYATVTYVQSFKVGGNYVWILESTGATLQTGAMKSGNTLTGSSLTLPTTVTGSNFSRWVPVKNIGSSAVIQGQILIASNTGTGFVMGAPATLDLTNTVGVAAEGIASGATGWMVPRGGGYAVILASGTIAIGDVLVSSGATAGYAWSDTTPTTGAQLAIAMSANTSGSGNPILAIIE